jgi:hypothetical protein
MPQNHSADWETLAFIVEFLRKHSVRNDHRQQLVDLPSISALDTEFLTYWKAKSEEHQTASGSEASEAANITTDALLKLAPNPVTGVSELFRRHLLTYGQFDLVTGRGSILL